MARWQPIASMVTMAPLSASSSNSLGIAAISLDFSAVASWPNTRRLRQAQALTMCSGRRPRARSCEPRAVLPSTATISPPVAPATAWVQLRKHSPKPFGVRREMTFAMQSCDGTPLSKRPNWRSQWSFSRPSSSIDSQPSAPLATAQIASNTMSSKAWRRLRSTLGSSREEKCSSRLAAKRDS